MMNKFLKITGLLLVNLIFTTGVSHAQGIDFKDVGFEEALHQADSQNKLIFIDFYTDWCGPCKALARGPFMDKKLGDFYNQNFINLKLNAEKGGIKAARKYRVNSYPTLLFVNAQGEIVYKVTGSRNVESLLASGKEALASTQSETSLLNLQKRFLEKQNDEAFLKTYIHKMKEYGASPVEGIEAWLKVQTEIKEDDVDMMEFLMNNQKYLVASGKAEEILNTNYNEYMDIATRAEESTLDNMKFRMAENTKSIAYQKQDAEMMRIFITAWKKLPEKKNFLGGKMKTGNLTDYELDYLLMKKDIKQFKSKAQIYLDSIVSAKSLAQLRADDNAIYEEYKENRYSPSIMGDATLKNLKQGKEAREQIRAIAKTAGSYLKHCKKANEYKQLHAWIDYAAKLVPEDFTMDHLKAEAFYKQGKAEQAIICMEKVLTKLPKNSRNRGFLQKRLNEMKSQN